MSNLQEQLATLRQRIARIDAKFQKPVERAEPPPVFGTERKPLRYFVEEWLSGQEVETRCGKHFETERLYERHRRHGSMDIGSLAELPAELLGGLSSGSVRACSPEKWAFLDTETTGLAGGTGTYAFLIGVGRITADGFYVRQFFMREQGEEASLLYALGEHLAQFDVLITYNGKTYDQPLLETRYRLSRTKPPFSRLEHLDLLFGARRLWKLRIDNCRLVNLENQILGVERVGDLPGDMIPYVYFEYLRSREAFKIAPILHHNAIDILSLACLTGIVPWAFHSAPDAPFTHGADMVGVGRWLAAAGKTEYALQLMRRALERGLKDELMCRTMWDVSRLEKKLKRPEAALVLWRELSTFRNSHQAMALAELAKHHEHKERDYESALAAVQHGMKLEGGDQWLKREARLVKRLAKKGPKLAASA